MKHPYSFSGLDISLLLKESLRIRALSQISALINDRENIIAYLEESKQRVSLAEKCGLFRTVESWWVWGWAEEPQKNFVIYTLIYTLINLYPYFQLLKSPGRMY